MSINHFSSPDTLWWNQMDPNSRAPNSWHHHHQDPHRHVLLNSQQSASMLLQQSPNPTPTRNFNLNGGEDEVEIEIEIDRHLDREPMFEKPLTPSDVGKLNRLVIPKQHAERYFPLGGGGESGGDKGLLLGFEDESGKAWRFRYSYWNSSQSYVLTKGWSRYVKEKKLDAGDAVLFHRHRTDCERFFIGWRRRNQNQNNNNSNNNNNFSSAAAHDSSGGGGFYRAQSYPAPFRQQPHDCTHHHDHHAAGSIGGGSNVVPAGNMKRLRLFGVNMECHAGESSEPSTPDGSSSTVTNHGGGPNYNYDQQRHYYYSPPDQYYVVGGS